MTTKVIYEFKFVNKSVHWIVGTPGILQVYDFYNSCLSKSNYWHCAFIIKFDRSVKMVININNTLLALGWQNDISIFIIRTRWAIGPWILYSDSSPLALSWHQISISSITCITRRALEPWTWSDSTLLVHNRTIYNSANVILALSWQYQISTL